jgi:hypothetical protein
MDQIRMLPLGTGLVALSPSPRVVRSAFLVRASGVENLKMKTVAMDREADQKDNGENKEAYPPPRRLNRTASSEVQGKQRPSCSDMIDLASRLTSLAQGPDWRGANASAR